MRGDELLDLVGVGGYDVAGVIDAVYASAADQPGQLDLVAVV